MGWWSDKGRPLAIQGGKMALDYKMNQYDPTGLGRKAGDYIFSEKEPFKFGEPPALMDPNSLETLLPEYEKRAAAMQGPGQWTQMRLQSAQKGAQQAQDAARLQGATQGAQVRSQLSQHGGLTGGAAERAAEVGARGAMLGSQAARSDAERNRLGIMGEGAQQQMKWDQDRLSGWSKLAGDEQDRRNQIRLGNQAMLGQMYGARESARAQEHSAPKQGLLGKLLGGLF